MAVTRGALKHGITAAEIEAVVAAPLWVVEQDDRRLLIGLNATRDLLEVVVDAEGTAVHAMRLRPKNYEHLRPA